MDRKYLIGLNKEYDIPVGESKTGKNASATSTALSKKSFKIKEILIFSTI
jgi:hypothetical protein